MLFENVEIKPPDIDLAAASQTLDSAREMAEDTWTEFSQSDTVSETIEDARNMADDAWEATAPVVETVATAASESARDTAYVAARAGLGVAKLGENAYKAVKTFGSKAIGDEEGAVETAQSSAIDDIAEDLGDKLDVSDEVKAIGDGAEVVGEVVGGIGVAVAAVALAPEGAATAVAVVGTDALFALDVSGEVLEGAASDGEITNEETAIAAGAGAGTAALGAVAGKAVGVITKGIEVKAASFGAETAGKEIAESIDSSALKEADSILLDTAEKGASKATVESVSETEAKDASESVEKFYTTYQERLQQVPKDDGPLGSWENFRGESKFVPADEATQKTLERYGVDGIEYRNCEPDFSKCSEATVEIDMTSTRYGVEGNFKKADEACAKLWNSIERDGKSDWTASEVKQWRRDNSFSWHERCDTKTCDLVSQDIHSDCTHSGGVAECSRRDGLVGGFDE